MGYRSTVALVLSREGVEKFRAELAAVDPELQLAVEQLLDDADFSSGREDGTCCYVWELMKWYAHNPNNYPAEAFIQKLADARLHYNTFLFLRVGEDHDDVEVCGAFWDNPFGVALRREITYDNGR